MVLESHVVCKIDVLACFNIFRTDHISSTFLFCHRCCLRIFICSNSQSSYSYYNTCCLELWSNIAANLSSGRSKFLMFYFYFLIFLLGVAKWVSIDITGHSRGKTSNSHHILAANFYNWIKLLQMCFSEYIRLLKVLCYSVSAARLWYKGAVAGILKISLG